MLAGAVKYYAQDLSLNKLELAQMVLNSASCNGLKDFDNMLLGGMNHPEEEGEDE